MKSCFRKFLGEHGCGAIVSDIVIGTLMRQRRHELGLTLEELAGHLGVTCQQVQRYECGRNRLNVENIQSISKALNVPVSYFFPPDMQAYERLPSHLDTAELMLLETFRQVDNGAARELVVKIVGMAAGSAGSGQHNTMRDY